MNLITLLVSEDEGSHRHVSNVFSDPVHLGHHLIHCVYVLTWLKKLQILSFLKHSIWWLVLSFTCNNDNCVSSGYLHSMRSWNNLETIPSGFIVQSNLYLFIECCNLKSIQRD